MVSSAIEDYLSAIYRFQVTKKEVKSRDLVSYLALSKSAVSEMLARLRKMGLITHERYSNVVLTKKGEKVAEKIVFKHRVIELFLTKMLDRKKEDVHAEAHKLEHAFTDQSIKKIYELLGEPIQGAHGEPIPYVKI